MKDAALEKLTVKELTDLKRRTEALIAVKQDAERVEVRERLKAMAEEAGYEVAELFSSGGRADKRGKGGGDVKYRNPKDPAQTWTGRGRRPGWINEAGGDIERFRIR